MVCGLEILANFRVSGLVHVARWKGAGTTPEQLGVDVWHSRLDLRPCDETVLLPLLLSRATRSELEKSSRGSGDVRRHALLVPARRCGLPPGCGGFAFRRSEPYRQRVYRRHGHLWPPEHGREIQSEAA